MAIALNQRKLSFAKWLQKITLNELFIPDDLTIYCLSRFLNVHTLVYTKDFCWSTLLEQFKMSEEELHAKSDIKLIYVGRDMYVELKHIRQPKPQPPGPVTPSSDLSDKKINKTKTKSRKTKVTNRGDKPCSKPPKKPTLPPPPEPRHSARKRRRINYLQLNDGLEEPDTTPDKPKRQKPNSPPPRQGPSSSRQAGNKKKCDNQGKPAHLHLQLEIDKLPDLVVNVNKIRDSNVVTSMSRTPRSASRGVSEFIRETSTPEKMTDPQSSNLDMPETTNTSVDTSVSNSFPTTLPVGHDTVTTTDEEEAAEALLALGNVSNDDEIVQEEDNATLMPIGKASTTVDINPVPLRLSVNDVNIAIQNMPDENKLKPTARVSTDPTTSLAEEKTTAVPDEEEIVESSSTNEDTNQKGQLKVKTYGLKKLKTIKESYIHLPGMWEKGKERA